jgi:hypothetical protein
MAIIGATVTGVADTIGVAAMESTGEVAGVTTVADKLSQLQAIIAAPGRTPFLGHFQNLQRCSIKTRGLKTIDLGLSPS